MSERVKKQNKAAIFFAICFFAYLTSYIGRNPFSALINSMATDGVLDKAMAGTVTTAYMILYGAGQLIFGKLARKLDPPMMMCVGLIGSGLCNVLMAFASSLPLCVILWGLCGAFNSMLWPSLTRAFSEWLPEEKKYNYGVNIGLSIPCGTVLSLLICSALLGAFPWRYCYIICGFTVTLAGIVCAIAFASLRPYMRERAELFETSFVSVDNKKSRLSIKTVFFSLAALVIPAVMINGALKESVTSWVPTIVSDLYGADAAFAAFMSLFIPIVCMLGSYVAKFIDKFVKNETRSAGILFVISAVCCLCLSLFGYKNLYVAVALIAISTCATWGINTMLVVLYPYRYSHLGLSGEISGLYNCLCCLFSGVMSTLYGTLALDHGWRTIFFVWLGLGIMAALCSFGASFADKKQK